MIASMVLLWKDGTGRFHPWKGKTRMLPLRSARHTYKLNKRRNGNICLDSNTCKVGVFWRGEEAITMTTNSIVSMYEQL